MSIKIRIVSDFDAKGIKQAEQQLGGLAKTAGIALAAVGAAMATVAVKSVQEFSKFDAALTQSKAIMGDLTEAMEKDMANAAREVAKATTFSAEQAGESFFFLASAGLDAEASIAALPRVAQFAQAGMFDMSRATDLLTDAQSALGLTIRDDAVKNMENMIKVSDVLVRANTLSNATVEQFSTSLTTKAGPALRTLGKDMEEGVAVLAAFADQGIKGEEAGTQLSIVLRDLSTKAIKNKEDFAQFGVSVFDANGEMRNLGDIVANLEDALDGMSDETAKATLLQMGFADRSVQSILALLGTSDAIKQYETSLRSASGFTDEVATKQLDTFSSQVKLLESAFIDVGIQIGEELTPYLRDLIPVLQDLLPVIGDKLVEAIKKVDWEGLIQSIADFITLIVDNIDAIANFAKVLGILTAALGVYATANLVAIALTKQFTIALLSNPAGAVAVAIAGLTAMLIMNNGEVSKANENYRQLNSQIDQTNYKQKNLADTYRESAYVADRYGIQTDDLRNANLKLAGAADMVSGELGRFNNIKLASVRDEMVATANAAREMFAATTFTGTGGTKSWLDKMFGTGPSTTFSPRIETDTGPSAFEQARERVRDLIKDSQKQLADAQKQYDKTILDANENFAQNVEKLQIEYANRLEGIIQQSQDRLRNAYASAVTSGASLSELFGVEDPEGETTKSVSNLVDGLQKRLLGSRNLLANSARLASAGFSQTFIEQVVSAGVDTGNELASAILSSTPQVQQELQQLFTALEIESSQGMDALAKQIYDKQGLATEALKDLYEVTQIEFNEALLEQQRELEDALIEANETFVKAITGIKDALKEQLDDMDGMFGGMGKTIDQFIGKLDGLIKKYGEIEKAAKLPGVSTLPETIGAQPEIALMPEVISGGDLARIKELDLLISNFEGIYERDKAMFDPFTTQEFFKDVNALKQERAELAGGTTINVNVTTDATQSPAMVGAKIAEVVGKYTGSGGNIKGLKVVAV